MKQIDLNCDLGESFGAYSIGMDEEVIPFVTSVNIGCGFHAGDPVVMGKTVALAKKHGVSIGAHPGFPDLMGFGRRNMVISPEEAKAYVKYQLGALMAFTMSCGEEIQHVKPHGALYNMAAKDYKLAVAMAEAVYETDKNIIFLGLSGSEMIRAAKAVGLRSASEVFADRAYNNDGSLVARSQEGAIIHDEEVCVRRVIRMVTEDKVECITGEDIQISPDSVCVHGDNPQALLFVKKINTSLSEQGITLSNMKRRSQ